MSIWQPQPKIIKQKVPNQPIRLYKGLTELIDGENIIEGKSFIYITWYPFPRIAIKFIYYGDFRRENSDVEIKLTKLISPSRIKVHFYNSTHYYSPTKKVEFLGYLTEPFRHGKKDNLSSVTFQITNFFNFNIDNQLDFKFDKQGNEIQIRREIWAYFEGQFIFDYENWHIVLANSDYRSDLEEKLDVEGGYAINHICKIEHLDNTQFNLDEAYEIIDAFIHYLSFVRGFWVAPFLVSGFDTEGNQILQEWRTPKIKADSWQSRFHSWTTSDTTEIVDFFGGFMKKWQNTTWKEVIQNTIQWYIESYKHTNGHNTSIILLQASLEKLAWTYLNSNEYISANGFQKLTFDDKVRLLLKTLNIPIMPMEANWEITKLAKEYNWQDSINLIGQIRNLIIHPKISKKKNERISEKMMEEVFYIGHSYLLECLLKLFEYEA